MGQGFRMSHMCQDIFRSNASGFLRHHQGILRLVEPNEGRRTPDNCRYVMRIGGKQRIKYLDGLWRSLQAK